MTRHHLKTGLVQVYTGDGKGKTSAALGLALRALGHGLKVYMVQFIKGGFEYGELHSGKQLAGFKLRSFGSGRFIKEKPPKPADVKHAQEAFQLAEKIVSSGDYDIVILDEINVAIDLTLIEVKEVIRLVQSKPNHVELVLTGRYAPQEIIAVADLVTEMKEIKHPYKKGVRSRKGIDY